MSESTNLEGSDPKSFAAGGLKMIPLEAMKEWKLTFKGKMLYVSSNSFPLLYLPILVYQKIHDVE